MRDRSPFGDLRVIGTSETRSPGEVGHERERPATRRDTDELHQAGPAGGSDGADLDPRPVPLVDRARQGILVQEGLGVPIEERQSEGRAVARRKRGTVLSHGILVATERFGKRLRRG
jgi:hypothetical protein